MFKPKLRVSNLFLKRSQEEPEASEHERKNKNQDGICDNQQNLILFPLLMKEKLRFPECFGV